MDLIFIYQQKRATDDETKPIFYNFGKRRLLTIYAYFDVDETYDRSDF